MVRTRFAPSPTGRLHIGGARTALFNWLFARHNKGKFVLRIEDTDLERSKEEYVEDILCGLQWLGFDWDEGPFFQRERLEIYRGYAFKLLSEGKAYKCFCSQEELEQKRNEALRQGRKPAYDRTCRERSDEPNLPFAIRFKTPLSGEVGFHDLIRGRITFRCEELDDLIILRSDGVPTYNFTVVIDDMLMEISHVIRGDDHINNTPRQILIYEALGRTPPKFAHVPLIHGERGGRLSKRHGATSLLEYREEGFLPEAMVNYLARLGWGFGDQELFSKEELIEKFDLAGVSKSPSIFNLNKLLWLNSHYIKARKDEDLAKALIPFLEKKGYTVTDPTKLPSIVRAFKGRAKTLKEMAEMASFFFDRRVKFEQKAKEKFLNRDTRLILEGFLEAFSSMSELNETTLRGLFEDLQKRFGKRLVDVVQPVRVALTGRDVSPGIFEVIEILGREITKERIRKAIEEIL